jgi:hypothetical protein
MSDLQEAEDDDAPLTLLRETMQMHDRQIHFEKPALTEADVQEVRKKTKVHIDAVITELNAQFRPQPVITMLDTLFNPDKLKLAYANKKVWVKYG